MAVLGCTNGVTICKVLAGVWFVGTASQKFTFLLMFICILRRAGKAPIYTPNLTPSERECLCYTDTAFVFPSRLMTEGLWKGGKRLASFPRSHSNTQRTAVSQVAAMRKERKWCPESLRPWKMAWSPGSLGS